MELPKFPSYLSMNENNNFLSKRNLVSFLLVGIGLLVIPFSVKMVQQQQLLKSKAAGDEVTFSGPNIEDCDAPGGKCATSDTIQVELRSPFGPPAGTPEPSASPTQTP